MASNGERQEDLSDLPRLLQSMDATGLSLAFTDPTTYPAGIRVEAHRASPGGVPLTPGSMFQAGSVSEALTAYAAYLLAADGRLDLTRTSTLSLPRGGCRT